MRQDHFARWPAPASGWLSTPKARRGFTLARIDEPGLPTSSGMKPRFPLWVLPLVLAFSAVLGGCSKSHNHSAASGGHVHTAPHGGTLIEVGDHAYNLELVRDAAAGKLTVYILDGHAENFIRIAAPSIELVAIAGGERRPLTLQAVANPATGETVGNTSQFEAQADWLKSTAEFPGTVSAIDIRGTKFNNIAIYMKR